MISLYQRLLSLGGSVTLGLTSLIMASPVIAQSMPDSLPDSRVDDCNLLAQTIDQSQGFMQNFEAAIAAFSGEAARVETLDDIKAAAQSYVEAVDSVVINLGVVQQDLQQLTVDDVTLTQFSADYANVIGGLAAALQDAGAAMQRVVLVNSEDQLAAAMEQSQSETIAAVERIESLAEQEFMLLRRVNDYCSPSE